MTIDEIRDKIAAAMNMKCDPIWWSILDNTTPGHYGVDDISFEIDLNDIWVDFKTKTFTFKKGELSFEATLGSTNDGVQTMVKKVVSGKGEWKFLGSNDIEVAKFEINESIDLME